MSETPVEENPLEHKLDEQGEEIHVDVDQQIPTGICKVCLAQEEATAPVPEVDESEEEESAPE